MAGVGTELDCFIRQGNAAEDVHLPAAMLSMKIEVTILACPPPRR